MTSLIRQTAFRFDVEDLALLDAIGAHLGTTSRNQTLRVMLRQYARARGIEPGPTKATKKGAAKR